MRHSDLLTLVQSLSKSEKRYFQTNSLTSPKQRFLQTLFTLLVKKPTITAAQLQEAWRSTHHKQLHLLKVTLFNKILDMLVHFHKDHNVASQLRRSLTHIDMLYQKKLYREMGLRLQKSRHQAEKYEQFPLLLELLHWERVSLTDQLGGVEAADPLERLAEEERDITDKLNRISLSKKLLNDIMKEKMAFEAKWASLPQEARSLQEFNTLSYAQSALYMFNESPEKAIHILLELIERYEALPHRISDSPSSYLTTLNNVVSYYLRENELDQAWAAIQKIKTAPDIYGLTDSQFTWRQQNQTLHLEMEYHRCRGHWIECQGIKDRIGKLERPNIHVPDDYYLLFAFQFMYLHFIQGHAQLFLHWNEKILRLLQHTPQQLLFIATYFLKCKYHLNKRHDDILRDDIGKLKKYDLPTHYVEAFRTFFRSKAQTKAVLNDCFRFLSKHNLKELHKLILLDKLPNGVQH